MTGQRFVTTTVEIEGREEIAVVEVPAFEPAPWGPDAALDTVGQRVPRLDAVEKVTGRARYTHDIRLPGMLHARLVRAELPAGRVSRLDLSRARALPGVRAVLSSPLHRRSGTPYFDALGVQIPEIPLTPARVLAALKKHSLGTG